MGSFSFKWDHPAEEVYVTGTFDNWAKSVKLEKKGSVFEKTVDLPNADKKIYYKFVVDGNWTTDHTASQETDEHGNTNNVLTPAEIKPGSAAISTVAPGATTAGLAGQVPKETPREELPGAFPETPAFETPAAEPASFSVNPIPATAGAGNPIHLEPGEKVPDPSTITSNTVGSTVKTDRESYEKADRTVTTGEKEAKPTETSGGMFGVPPVTKDMIPESSLPIGENAKIPSETDGVTIQSAAPNSTTAGLAGQVPLEPRGVPEVVTESQQEAGVSPEASSNAEAVAEKKEVEDELKDKIPEAPAATEGGTNKEGLTGSVVGGAVAAGAAATGAAVAAKEKLPESVQKPIREATGSSTTAPDVPAIVSESIKKAHESPEAAANEVVVKGKAAVEQELEQKISPTEQAGEPAPTATAATSATAPGSGSLSPNALVSQEPLKSSEEVGLNAPASAPATTSTAEAATEKAAVPTSGDISPSTKPTGAAVTTGTDTKTTEPLSEPAVPTEAGPATPKKDVAKPAESVSATPDSSTADKSRKKKNRVSSFFGKLKEKLK